MQSKNFHAKVWKVSLENTTTWKIKSSTSVWTCMCKPNLHKLGLHKIVLSSLQKWFLAFTLFWKDPINDHLCIFAEQIRNWAAFQMLHFSVLNFYCPNISSHKWLHDCCLLWLRFYHSTNTFPFTTSVWRQIG